MSWIITLRGSDTNNVATATPIELEGLGVKPYFIDEGSDKKYDGGLYRRLKKSRLAFEITLHDFEVVPHAAWQDSRSYFDLMALLHKKHIWIYDVGEEFVRIVQATTGLVDAGKFTLPFKVDVYSWPDYGETFEEGTNQLTGLVLADTNLWTF